jgi:hypothetical protein
MKKKIGKKVEEKILRKKFEKKNLRNLGNISKFFKWPNMGHPDYKSLAFNKLRGRDIVYRP